LRSALATISVSCRLACVKDSGNGLLRARERYSDQKVIETIISRARVDSANGHHHGHRRLHSGPKGNIKVGPTKLVDAFVPQSAFNSATSSQSILFASGSPCRNSSPTSTLTSLIRAFVLPVAVLISLVFEFVRI
jgi:hypothetical protein